MKHTTTVTCYRCYREQKAGPRQCSCGFPLPPPCKLVNGFDVVLNQEEIDLYDKEDEDE